MKRFLMVQQIPMRLLTIIDLVIDDSKMVFPVTGTKVVQ